MNGHKKFSGGTKFESEDQKKEGLHGRICERTVLAHKFWGDDQDFGGFRPRTALRWHRACYFLCGAILALGGTVLVLGGTSSDLGGHGPGMPPRGAGPGALRILASTMIALHRYAMWI